MRRAGSGRTGFSFRHPVALRRSSDSPPRGCYMPPRGTPEAYDSQPSQATDAGLRLEQHARMRTFEPMEGCVPTDGGDTRHCDRIGWGQLEPMASSRDGAYRQSRTSTLVDRSNIKNRKKTQLTHLWPPPCEIPSVDFTIIWLQSTKNHKVNESISKILNRISRRFNRATLTNPSFEFQ